MSDTGFIDRVLSSIPEGDAHWHEQDPSIDRHLLAWRTLEPRLRILLGVMLAEIGAAVLVLGLGDRLPGTVDLAGFCATLAMADLFKNCVSISLASYLLTYATVFGGLLLLVAGATRAAPKARLSLLVLLATTFAIGILGRPNWLGLLGTMLLVGATCAGAVMLPPQIRALGLPKFAERLIYAVLIFFLSLVALAFLLFPQALTALLLLLHVPLVFLFLIAGTDWAEIDDALIRWAARKSGLAGSETALFAANGILCTGALATLSALAGWSVLLNILPALVAAVAIVAALRSSRFNGNWPVGMTWVSLVLVVVAFEGLLDMSIRISGGARIVAGAVNARNYVALWGMALTFTAGAFLLLRLCGRQARLAWLAPALLFAVVLGVLYTTLLAADADALEGLCFAAVIGTLFALAWLSSLRNAGHDVRRPLFLLFALDASLIVLLALARTIYVWLQNPGSGGALFAAAIVFGALVWDMLTCGQSITSDDGRNFPRRARVLLFFGYVTLAVATIVFWTSWSGTGDDVQVPHILGDSDRFVQFGITEFAPAMLITLFVLRFGKWLADAGLMTGRPQDRTAAE